MNSQIVQKKKLVALIVMLVLLVGVLGLATITVLGVASVALVNASPLQLTTPTSSAEAICAKQVILDPRLPPEKLQAEQLRYQSCLQAYNTRLTPKLESTNTEKLKTPRIIVGPTAALPRTPAGAGIVIDDDSSPLGPQYIIQNSWVIESQGKRFQVFAGARREEGSTQARDTMQGVVVVWVTTLNGEVLPEAGYYNVPVKKGPVKIVGAQDQRLILQAENGAKFYFDLPARKFVSSLTEKAATVTPPAKPTTRAYP